MFSHWKLGNWKQRLKIRSQPTRKSLASDLATEIDAIASESSGRIHELFLQTLLGTEGNSELSVPEKLVGQAIAQSLNNNEQRAAAVPRLPTVIPLLLRQLRDPNASSRDYASIITQDPVLSTAVLRVANSVFFNPYRKTLDNFEHAVTALGILKLRMVLSTAVLQPVLLDRGDNLPQKVWDHSLAVAVCCQHLAERENADTYMAYMSGLMHDIGVVTLYNQTQLLSREYLDTKRPSATLLKNLIERWAQPLAQWVAEDWKMPPVIIQALTPVTASTQSSQLARIVQRANELCEAYAVCRAGQIDREELERLAARLKCPTNMLGILDSGYSQA